MAISLNHTIVPAHDKKRSAQFLAGILGLTTDPEWGPFVPLRIGEALTLDFADSPEFTANHYAFLVDDQEFDAIFARIGDVGLAYYAGPHHDKPGEINRRYGGRGVYFDDPDGHCMEITTRAEASPAG